ncbi:hypothetical protein [Agrobacterium tumefaciens]|uniref:hypothetical protein n=1 Tax=Agrobacterium tumefaciens TaxID=358 RepID=UPI0021CECD18|nr:hypothetical protein [Agrobacterium tumefaciens]UXT97968.1 hypothetical protein FY129_11055 [Agrobacterium tumefaciens]
MTKTIRINGPSGTSGKGLKYQEECQFALEPSVTRLIELAIEAGWSRDQVAYALLSLAAPHLLDRAVLEGEFTYQ